MISRFFNWIARTLSDGENPSAGRLIAVATILFVNITPVAVWDLFAVYTVIFGGATVLPEYPGSVIGMQSAITTPLLGYLYLHKKEEGVQNAQG